jgi:hypothetical protein
MKSIVVYDKQYYFFRYIKFNFKDFLVFKVNIINLLKYKKIKKANLIFFVVYDRFDKIPFMFFYKINKNLVVCSDDKLLLSQYQKIDQLICFDTSKPKAAFLEEVMKKIRKEYN